MSRDPGRHTVTLDAADGVSRDAVAIPFDALTAPSNDDLIDAGLSLWPQGAAWGTPDGVAMGEGSHLARLTRVLLSPFEWLYVRAFSLAREATVSGVGELLAEWERDFGLPGACDLGEQSTDARLSALAAKVMSVRVITPQEFVRLTLEYGFVVAIEEPAIFGCGDSECGGEHECGDYSEEVYVVVRVRDLRIGYFRIGEGELNADPLFDYGSSQKLICIIRQVAPAWTIPVLGEWRYFGDYDELAGPTIVGGHGWQMS